MNNSVFSIKLYDQRLQAVAPSTHHEPYNSFITLHVSRWKAQLGKFLASSLGDILLSGSQVQCGDKL